MLRVGLSLFTLWVGAAVAATTPLRIAPVADLRSIAEPPLERGVATEPRFDAFHAGMVEALPPQERAERALELAINRRSGAADYVMENAESWRGLIVPGATLKTLIDASGDSPLIEVRMAGFELYLAQYGLEKSGAEVARQLARMASDPEGSGPFVLWTIGVLGARGVDREHVFEVLLRNLRAPEKPLQLWAVEALAKFGGSEIIEPLLDVAAHKRSFRLRERAFCALAQSGTLHVAERYDAVPGLFAIAEDVDADRQTVTWTYQALREITDTYDLPDDADAWRERLRRVHLL